MRKKYIAKFRVSVRILSLTQNYLRQRGKGSHEGLVFWTGQRVKNDEFEITNCICPEQTTSLFSAEVSLGEAARIHYLLLKRKELLLAQVHSHPGSAFHSFTDNTYPVTHKLGFISVVVPQFCRVSFKDLSDCRVYEHTGAGSWRELGKKEIQERFTIFLTEESM